jgi:hypothetical protein
MVLFDVGMSVKWLIWKICFMGWQILATFIPETILRIGSPAKCEICPTCLKVRCSVLLKEVTVFRAQRIDCVLIIGCFNIWLFYLFSFFSSTGAQDFNSNIAHWNVFNVKDMTSMFNGCTHFTRMLCDKTWIDSTAKGKAGMFAGSLGHMGNVTCAK